MNAQQAVRLFVGAVVVLGTYGVWLVLSWQGQPVNPLVATVALVVTLMGARVVFGPGSVKRAIDALSNIKEVHEKSDSDEDQTESK